MKTTACFPDTVLASYRPERLSAGPLWKLAAVVMGAAGVSSLAFAIVTHEVLAVSVTGPMLFALWAGLVAVGCWQGPKLWYERVRYYVTDKQVVVANGFYRRSIERSAISFARIRWDRRHPGLGDVELVRAVAAGPLRRHLTIRLVAVRAPDQIWALIRGHHALVTPRSAPLPLGQRLDPGERVIWSGRRRPRWTDYLPRGKREAGMLILGLTLSAIAVVSATSVALAVGALVAAGLEPHWAAMTVGGHGVTTLALLVVASFLVHQGLFRPAFLGRSTRYLVTNQRLLILRGNEELHLGREHIVDAVDVKPSAGAPRLTLVLDRTARAARRTATELPSLMPTLEDVDDVEGLLRALSLRPVAQRV